MSAVLGISADYHDSAAALVVDGVVIAAIQEERLSRIKNDPSLPIRAVRECLSIGSIDAQALDAVVFYENPYSKLERVLVGLMRVFPRSLLQFPRALRSQLGGKLWILDRVADALDIDRKSVEHVDHHRSHAASAFFVSPYEEAAVVVVDAVGEHESTTIWKGSGSELTSVASLSYPHSLGLFYAAMTAFLGFRVNEGEYKLMGLAAFGQPRMREEFSKLLKPSSDGSFALALRYFARHADADLGFSPALESLLGPRRSPSKPWNLEDETDRRYADIAATTQAVTEEALLAIAIRARELTQTSALCLAGGVALNAVANARIAKEAGFDRVFVQPAAGDAGGALGAAILGAIERGDPRPAAMTSCALGPAIDVARAASVAKAAGLSVRRTQDLEADVANSIASGDITAVACGRLEWGPRALGQRSILALPRNVAVRDRINRIIKRRESFRPFAPATLEDGASKMFDAAPNDMTPFMTTTCEVRDAARDKLAAVTHADGSARVQTVSTGVLADVLAALEKGGEPPVVLNTSLNGRGEPIVCTAEDAVAFFSRHPIERMFIEDVVLERRPRPGGAPR